MRARHFDRDAKAVFNDHFGLRLGSAIRRKLLIFWWRNIQAWQMLMKRGLDIVLAMMGLLLLSPLLLLISLLIKLADRGPVLFWQERVGKYGKPFHFPKFRSMGVDAEAILVSLIASNQHGDGVTFKMKRDPRITSIGRVIRRASIDELPQLWCVLKGEMSLVGPRPPLVHEVARYTIADRRRLECTPGLTCHWQVRGRSEIPFSQQVELDVDYIENHNLVVDIKLLAQTIPAVLSGKGAY
jgi:lipopolysaccharide/colanic/teichoic acid biosynthesis glycosyltransferase